MRVPRAGVDAPMLGANQLLVRASVGCVLPLPLIQLHLELAR